MSRELVSSPGAVGGLWSDPLSYILPQSDADYQLALQQRSLDPDKYSSLDGLFASFGFCVLLLMLRFLYNGCFQAAARAYKRSKDGQEVIDKLEEELWVAGGGVLLLVLGWQCLNSVSSYCSLTDTSGCLRNWPLIPVEQNVLKYYNVELGWYLQLVLKHPLGLGLQDNATMAAHHLATVALVVLSYMLNVHLLGLLVFCVLSISTPLLHMSKLASTLEMQRTKTVTFAGFALVFFLTRVVVFPYVIIKAAMYDPLINVRGVLEYFTPFYMACNVLLLVLCVMQGVWFTAVLRILKAAMSGSNKQLQEELSKRDPAGRGKKFLVTASGVAQPCPHQHHAATTAAGGMSSSNNSAAYASK